MGHFGVHGTPPFDAVFNKTASLTQSLYARARIGIVSSGVNGAHFGPILTPVNTPTDPLDPTDSWNGSI